MFKHQVQKDFSRFKALNNALQPNTQFKEAAEWFYAMEFEELKNQQIRQDFNYRLPALYFETLPTNPLHCKKNSPVR